MNKRMKARMELERNPDHLKGQILPFNRKSHMRLDSDPLVSPPKDRRHQPRTSLAGKLRARVFMISHYIDVSLFDISSNGIGFDIEGMGLGHFGYEEQVTLRLYVYEQTYFEFKVRVKHLLPLGGGGTRHGCEAIVSQKNGHAFQMLSEFFATANFEEDLAQSTHQQTKAG